jgi:hypothetical protein
MAINAVSAYSVNATLYKYGEAKTSDPGQKKPSGLSEEDQAKIRELTRRDQDVRSHEAAHAAAGGQYVKGGATFSYQKGPDGKMYATGGEVSIDTSPVKGDPQATISKMETIKRAALAPADPSGQDRSVASAASAAEGEARQELTQKNVASIGKEKPSSTAGSAAVSASPKTHSYNQKGIASATAYSANSTATVWGLA